MRRPRQTLVAVVAFAAIATWGASSAAGQATAVQQQTLGADPIVVSLTANLAATLDPANLSVELVLERQLAALPGVSSVSGPATFIQEIADVVNSVIRLDVADMRPPSAAAAAKDLRSLLVRYGYSGTPSLGNHSFIGQLIFGSGTEPQQRLRWLFPDDNHALVLIRPRGELGDARTRALRAEVQRLVAAAQFEGVQTAVTGPSSALYVEVRARDVTAPAVVQWMLSAQNRIDGLDPRLRPGPSLANLLSTGAGESIPTPIQIRDLLAIVPPSLTSAVLSPDHTLTELSFGLPRLSSGAQTRLVQRIEHVLSRPPAGVTVQPVGPMSSATGVPLWLLLLAAAALLAAVGATLRKVDFVHSAPLVRR